MAPIDSDPVLLVALAGPVGGIWKETLDVEVELHGYSSLSVIWKGSLNLSLPFHFEVLKKLLLFFLLPPHNNDRKSVTNELPKHSVVQLVVVNVCC